MKVEASKVKTFDKSYSGGILIDEMSIQEDLCMARENGGFRLLGFIETGDVNANMNTLSSGKKEKKLASHVLQFLFLGLNGFRFPFACFPVSQSKPSELHFLFWKAVQYLNVYGFTVTFISMDGAQTNRDFLKMFFQNTTPLEEKYTTTNIFSPSDPKIAFIMDYSHVIKRVRNNILKSGDTKACVRNLKYNNNIYWDHWINAFKWDTDTNSFPIHRKLTNEHFYLTQESKMRNGLAEAVLDKDMLYLMKCFQKSMPGDGEYLNDTISLLESTSTIVSEFRDHRPITNTTDERLGSLQQSLNWFHEWETHVKASTMSSAEKVKNLFPHKLEMTSIHVLLDSQNFATSS